MLRNISVYLWLATSAGCTLLYGSDAASEGGDGGKNDGDTISSGDGGPCGWSFAPRGFDPCIVDPQGDLTLAGDNTYFTDDLALVEPGGASSLGIFADSQPGGGPPVSILALHSLTIEAGASLVAYGERPLVIASVGDVLIEGSVSVSSVGSSTRGAGGEAGCGSGEAGFRGTDSLTGSGGGGGGFGSPGGTGGIGDVGQGGQAGTEAVSVAFIRGGCRGGSGGLSTSGTSRSDPGMGGGAIHISAKGTITIRGSLLAGGGGGSSGLQEGGGAGGGSGGYIGAESVAIILAPAALLAANGGGGGTGAQDGVGGAPGEDGGAGTTPAAGGRGASNGGDGAAGMVSASDGEGGGVGIGGGGGGGGTGYVLLRGGLDDQGATISGALLLE